MVTFRLGPGRSAAVAVSEPSFKFGRVTVTVSDLDCRGHGVRPIGPARVLPRAVLCPA